MVTNPVANGQQAQKISGAGLDSNTRVKLYQDILVEANKPFELTANVSIEVLEDANVEFYVDFYDGNGNELHRDNVTRVSASDGYAELRAQGTVPGEAARATIAVLIRGTAAGGSGTIYVDDVSIILASPPSLPLTNNLVVNPGFESDLTDWTDWGGISVVTTPVASGQKAVSIGTGEGGAGQLITGITADATYTLSGSGAVSASGEVGLIGIDCLDADGVKLDGGNFELTFDETVYKEKSVTFITVPGTVDIQLYIYKDANIGGNVYVDDLSIIPTSPPVTNNLIANPGFESDLTDWTNWGGPVL